jgi:hypothetical protein
VSGAFGERQARGARERRQTGGWLRSEEAGRPDSRSQTRPRLDADFDRSTRFSIAMLVPIQSPARCSPRPVFFSWIWCS